MTVTAYGLCGVKAVGVDPVFFIILLFYKKKINPVKRVTSQWMPAAVRLIQLLQQKEFQCGKQKRIHLQNSYSKIHLSVFFCLSSSGLWGEGEAYPSCHGARGGVHPGQALNFHSTHTKRQTTIHTYSRYRITN